MTLAVGGAGVDPILGWADSSGHKVEREAVGMSGVAWPDELFRRSGMEPRG